MKTRCSKINKRTGSATVMALIFMLFLSIAGGAWVMMLAHENSVAASDEAEQAAWYAAEAGLKRAKAELNALHSDWAWTTSNTLIPDNIEASSDGYFALVATGGSSGDNSNSPAFKQANYGVYILDKAENKSVKNSGVAIKPGRNYELVAVGRYAGMRKVLKEEWTVPGGNIIPGIEDIRNWEESQGVFTGTNPHAIAEKAFENSGLAKQLSREEVQSIVGAGVVLPTSFPWQVGKDYEGDMFLKSAGAVMLDGKLGNIQMLAGHPSNPSNDQGKWAVASFIVDGETYIFTKTDSSGNNVLTIEAANSCRLSNPISIEIKDAAGNVTEVRTLLTLAQVVQTLNRAEAISSFGWQTYTDQYAWFKSALEDIGFTKVN